MILPEACWSCDASLGSGGALYHTPLCLTCARGSSLRLLMGGGRLVILLDAPCRSRRLNWHDESPGAIDYMRRVLERRRARLCEICTGHAQIDDPALLYDLPDIIAARHWTPFVRRVLARRDETIEAIASVERLLGFA